MAMSRRRFLAASSSVAAISIIGPQACLSQAPPPKQSQLNGAPVSLYGASLTVEPRVASRFGPAIGDLEAALHAHAIGEPSVWIDFLGSGTSSLRPEIHRELAARAEAYWVSITPRHVHVVGSDLRGALHGIAFLESVALRQGGITASGELVDWPDHPVRAVHAVLRGVTAAELERVARRARQARFNTLILSLADAVRYASAPGIARPDALDWNELLAAIRFAERSGLRVIPHLTLLTHQEIFLKNHYPHLRFNKVTYDPRQEATYALVFSIIEEVLSKIPSAALHIGHDEVAGLTAASSAKWLAPGEPSLPPELFAHDVSRLHQFLAGSGVETWLWGDMLVAPEEFPEMSPAGMNGLHGYARQRRALPDGLVICDWHYFDRGTAFPSAAAFLDDRFRVLGATWKNETTVRNFSKYINRLPADALGMVATLWFHLQRREWDIVEHILMMSGDAFWRAPT